MKNNPLYYIVSLAQNLPSKAVFKKGNSSSSPYALFNLKCAESNSVLSLSEHHITIHEKYNDQVGVMSQYHYTAKYCVNSKTLTAHVYLNAQDQVINITLVNEKHQTFNAGSGFYNHLQETAINHTKDYIVILRQAIKHEVKTADEYFKTNMNDLAGLSVNLDQNLDLWCKKVQDLTKFFKDRYQLFCVDKYEGPIDLLNKIALDARKKEQPEFSRSLSCDSMSSQNSQASEAESIVVTEEVCQDNKNDQSFEELIRRAIGFMDQYDKSKDLEFLKRSIDLQLEAVVDSLQNTVTDVGAIQKMVDLKDRQMQARCNVIMHELFKSNVSKGKEEDILRDLNNQTQGFITIEDRENPPQEIINLFKVSICQLNVIGCKFLLDKYDGLESVMIDQQTVAQYIFSRSHCDSKKQAGPGALVKCFEVILDAWGIKCLQVRVSPSKWMPVVCAVLCDQSSLLFKPLDEWMRSKNKTDHQRIGESLIKYSLEKVCRAHYEKLIQKELEERDMKIATLTMAARKFEQGSQELNEICMRIVLTKFYRDNLRLWCMAQDNVIDEISRSACKQMKDRTTEFDFEAFIKKEGDQRFFKSIDHLIPIQRSRCISYMKTGSYKNDMKEIAAQCSAQPN